MSNLHSIDVGFDREDVLLFTIRPGAVGYEGAALTRLYRDLRERLSHISGVRSVSLSSRPLPAGTGTATPVTIDGMPVPAGRTDSRGFPPNEAGVLAAGPAFFETMRIPLIAGREFEDRDAARSVVIVNRQLARVFGLENPVGHTITFRRGTLEIVGLVEDALFLRLKDDFWPMVYLPYSTQPGMTYEVRASGNPLDHVNTVRQIVRQMDSRLALSDVKTQSAHIDQLISLEITLARLCTIFGVLALIIACVGLYGTVAHNVERRTGEIGIRMALGARRARIIWLVLREVFILGLLGLAIGIPAALVGSRYVKSFLYGVPPNDPVSVTLAVLILLATGLAAGYLPALRASRIDPMEAVRNE